jgi:hypothetical protein
MAAMLRPIFDHHRPVLAVCRPPYRFYSQVQQAFGAIVFMPPAPPATKPATLTFRVGCESEHGIAEIRPSPMSS